MFLPTPMFVRDTFLKHNFIQWPQFVYSTYSKAHNNYIQPISCNFFANHIYLELSTFPTQHIYILLKLSSNQTTTDYLYCRKI